MELYTIKDISWDIKSYMGMTLQQDDIENTDTINEVDTGNLGFKAYEKDPRKRWKNTLIEVSIIVVFLILYLSMDF